MQGPFRVQQPHRCFRVLTFGVNVRVGLSDAADSKTFLIGVCKTSEIVAC